MPDLGHELTFGLFLPNPASQAATVVRLAQIAEQSGLDLIGVQDHPYNPDLLDTWTLLSHLAVDGERVLEFVKAFRWVATRRKPDLVQCCVLRLPTFR